ncbi:hypothetical protein [Parasitella parasitica]|uniref:PX domain-containing protein n=1 Tax=Parasitella parasitica TaxID=35722 RepID=A0A0B7NMM0_9FUNG|nr:hypothetical protein [Parasitella parasitica]
MATAPICLTPKQLHYFKRELITEQLINEIDTLIKNPDIASILDKEDNETTPFLRYIFQNMIIEFPLLKHTCDDNFWPKCKIFLNEFSKVNLDAYYTPRSSESQKQRKMIQHKIQKSLVFAFCASIKTLQGQEESIRVNPQESAAAAAAAAAMPPTAVTATTMAPTVLAAVSDRFKVNIVTVRQIKEKKTLREVSHAEFLIETWFPHQSEPVYVGRRHGEFRRLRDQLKHQFKNMDIPLVPSKSANTVQQEGFRENDRLLLRSFLYHLTGDPCGTCSKHQQQIQKSHTLRKFLSDSPILFTVQEEQDARLREAADNHRLEKQQQYQKELDERVLVLNETLEDLKKEILQPGGLTGVFEIIKRTRNIQDLPVSLKKAFEWGRIKQFLTSDIATENLNNLRRTHGLMPYRTMAVILRFSNPMSMMKSILDLFLAQPFGGRSLFQRIIISNMNEESKAFEKDIKLLQEKINDKQICQKLYNAVRTPLPEHSNFRDHRLRTMEALDLLGNDQIKPLLSAEQIAMLSAFDETHDTKKQIKHIVQLWELYARQYEQELMMNLVFQGVTGELLKEFISVFYQPLAQVYKAADISSTIRHVASFLDDLLQVIDELPANLSVNDTIQLFIDLVQRHEQHFYEFVHNVHSQEASKVFDELIQYLDKIFTFIAQGIPGKIDIWHSIEKVVSKQELPALEEEIDAICQYRYQQKIYHFERQRRKLIHQQSIDDSTDGLTKNPAAPDQKHQIDIFQYIPRRNELADAIGDFEESQFEDEAISSLSMSGSDEESMHGNQSSGSSLESRRSSKSSSSRLSHVGIEKPVLKLIPKIVPYFVQDVVDIMKNPNNNNNA